MQLKIEIPFVCYLLLIIGRNAIETRLKPSSHEKTKTLGQGTLSLFIFIASYIFSAFVVGKLLLELHDTTYPLFVLGALVMILAYIGRIVSVKKMGKSYDQFITPNSEGNFVTSGPFGVIRHPLYMLYTLEMAAFILIRFNMISLAALLVVISVSLYRAAEEEKLMEEKFGKAYLDYSKKTKRFFPFIY